MQNLLNSFVCGILSAGLLLGNTNNKVINVYGETSFSKKETESLQTSFNFKTEYTIYEPTHKKWSVILTNIVNPELDHFQNEIRINVFTTIGISF